MIKPGTMVPFQLGFESVKAMVLGLCCEDTQYMLRFTYEAPDENTGQYVTTERSIQRDRKFIEQLWLYARRHNI